jgi:NitT/TauT family transport system substrate-binding protein
VKRRQFLRETVAAGAACVLLGGSPRPAMAEPPPETTRLRLPRTPSICVAPQYLAEELLRGEGFTSIEWVSGGPTGSQNVGVIGARRMGAGEIDVQMNFAGPLVVSLDAGIPIVVLAGVHVGCFELIATGGIRTVGDLKGKAVAVVGVTPESPQYVFLAVMVTQVGLDPRRDIRWVTYPPSQAKQLLAEGKIDAFLGFPPDPQELRAKKIGHVIVNSAVDRPWSQYFCCMVAANREFAAKNPVAARRALRAILKADRICSLEPERAARAYLDRGYPAPLDYAVQAVKEIPYGRWRDYNPEETIRF